MIQTHVRTDDPKKARLVETRWAVPRCWELGPVIHWEYNISVYLASSEGKPAFQ